MTAWRRCVVVTVMFSLLLPIGAAFGQETENTSGSDVLKSDTHKIVLREIKAILEKTRLVRLGEKQVTATLVPEPVLNWDDLARGHHHGTLWVWGEKGRPVAIIETYTTNFSKKIEGWPGNVVHSLSTDPLKAEGSLPWDWAPETPGFTPRKLNDAAAPAATKAQRRLQMRALAKRFSANQTWDGARDELRLLTTPVRLYDSEDEGILDGGLFTFVHGGSNPEIVLILEAVQSQDGQYWQSGCVRLGHAAMQVKFDDTEAWSVDKYDAVNPRGPYYWLSKP